MAIITFSKLLSLAAIVTAAKAQYWIFGGTRPIVTTRLDPVVFPNSVIPVATIIVPLIA